jgi:hypothetical protein
MIRTRRDYGEEVPGHKGVYAGRPKSETNALEIAGMKEYNDLD